MFNNQDIETVYDRFSGLLVKTPCVFSPYLSKLTQANIYLKLENMQRTGSFKERGALNFLLNHTTSKKMIVTASAGNHAQAVAMHAERLGLSATIFMPNGTSNTKVLATERFHATVKLSGDSYDEAYKKARDYAALHNAAYLHAYNDAHVIAGQATVALEIYSQINSPDVIVVPVGGGGLISGIAQFVANLKTRMPKIIGVEASDFQSMAKALKKETSPLLAQAKTIAEGIAVRNVGEMTKHFCERLVPELTSTSDFEIEEAIMLLLERQKIVTEGAGAAPVAALLKEEYRHSFVGKTVVLIISGGNIDISLLARLTSQELVKSNRLCRLSVIIKDSPGSLSRLLATVTQASGNIVDIHHERLFADIKWNEVLVFLTVETKDEIHRDVMLLALAKEGYSIDILKREPRRA